MLVRLLLGLLSQFTLLPLSQVIIRLDRAAAPPPAPARERHLTAAGQDVSPPA